ncbi:hypothetical protein C2S51_006983 [Perilla frutescens var. frutescens]|nr:hypothetical protein C2S51_006983 [Perilla frutescens var. frutescens]
MDVTQTLEDVDYELQLLESVSTRVSTANCTKSLESNKKSIAPIGTHTSSTFDDPGGSKSRSRSGRVDNLDGGNGKRIRSDVWKYNIRIGKINGAEKCECKNCGKLYTCNPDSGTNHLKCHVEKCLKTPLKYHDVGVMLDNQTTLAKTWAFDSKAYRDALARSIIQHDLSFSYCQYDVVNALNKVLNPDFKPISRNTAKSDCMNVYLLENDKLKSLLSDHEYMIKMMTRKVITMENHRDRRQFLGEGTFSDSGHSDR